MNLRFSIDARTAESMLPEFRYIMELAQPVLRPERQSWEGSVLLTVANVNRTLANLSRLGAWLYEAEKDVMKQVFNEALYQLRMFSNVRTENVSTFFNRSFGLCDNQRI